jgi:hypothetical protein
VTQPPQFIHAFRPKGRVFGRYDIHRGFVQQVMVRDSQLLAGHSIAINNLSLEVHDEYGVASTFK